MVVEGGRGMMRKECGKVEVVMMVGFKSLGELEVRWGV